MRDDASVNPDTVVIAHRTCPAHAVENSLDGIRRAAELGADYVEVDVRRSRDGVAMLHHDRTHWRMAKVPVPLRWMSSGWAERVRLPDGSSVPTLADALFLGRELGIGFALDTKDRGAAPATLDAVRAADMEERVLLWSQHEAAVRHYATNSGAETALLRDTLSDDEHERFLDDAETFGAAAISAHPDALDEAFVADARSRGLRIYAWFQTPDPLVDQLAAVDGVVTDWPDRVRELLG